MSPRATGICTSYIFIQTNTIIILRETFSYPPIFIETNSSCVDQEFFRILN